MVDDEVVLDKNSSLNIEGMENKPVCPVCQEYLENADRDYEYNRLNPDTRWFWCPRCEGHLGYHRIRGKWKVDPYDLNDSEAFRTFFGVEAE